MIYHKDVHFPRKIKGLIPTGIKSLVYSGHAKRELTDKYGKIVPPTCLDFSLVEVIEATIFGQKVDKLVLRTTHNEDTDVVLVCIPTENKKVWFVKTVWLNQQNDKHTTLDVNRFAMT